MILLLLFLLMMVPATALADTVLDSSVLQAQSTRTAPLTIEEVLARIELTHPLLKATGLERAQARAKVLKALAAWEPKVRNEVEFDRYQTFNLTNVSGAPNHLSSGYNDLFIKLGHPWGWELFVGIRNVFGDHCYAHGGQH